jgi:hypothetical protein
MANQISEKSHFRAERLCVDFILAITGRNKTAEKLGLGHSISLVMAGHRYTIWQSLR